MACRNLLKKHNGDAVAAFADARSRTNGGAA
jgi:hypothetical protein